MLFVTSLRSRLNCDNIEAGLVTNHCKNRSDSPLERRTHAEQETEEIYFNRHDLKPNRVSTVIRL